MRNRSRRRAAKVVWHPLSLQQLAPGRFINVVNSILSGRSVVRTGTLRSATSVSEDEQPIRPTRVLSDTAVNA